MRNNRFLLPFFLIAGCIVIVFSPSLRNGFTNWDDDVYVTNNPDIRKVTIHNVVKVFSSSYASTYQPLTMLSYMAQFAVDGPNPAVFHYTSLFFHIISGLLVFALLYGLSKSYFIGIITALIFAVHPLRTESVAWVADQKDLLSAIFYLLSLLAYNVFTKNNTRKYYWLSLIGLVFSLLSKPMAISQPFVLLLLDYICNKNQSKKSLVEKVPFFAIAAGFAAITLMTQHHSGAINSYPSLPVLDRVCVPFYGMVFYIVKFFIPVKLAALYPMPSPDDHFMNFVMLASPFIVVSVAALLWSFRAKSKTAVAGCLFFFITLVPVLQIVPIGSAIVSDRYSYVPLLGISAIVAGFLARIINKNPTKATRSIVYTACAVLFFAMGSLTFQRCAVWSDSLALWNDDIGKYPSVLAYNNRATEYGNRGETDRAIEDFTKALYCDPKFAKTYDNRGIAYLAKGMADQALADFNKTIELDHDYYDAYNNRGIIYCFYNEFDKAIADFSTAIALKSDYEKAYSNRGLAYMRNGSFAAAIKDFDLALALDPGDETAREKRFQAITSLQTAK